MKVANFFFSHFLNCAYLTRLPCTPSVPSFLGCEASFCVNICVHLGDVLATPLSPSWGKTLCFQSRNVCHSFFVATNPYSSVCSSESQTQPTSNRRQTNLNIQHPATSPSPSLAAEGFCKDKEPRRKGWERQQTPGHTTAG